MSYLLDTCVLSQGAKAEADEGLAQWLAATPIEEQFVSVLSFTEIEFGILRMPSGQRRLRFEEWFALSLKLSFAGRVLAFEESTASAWAALRARDPNCKFADSQIAATALAHGLTLVTRNIRDFRFPGLAVFNPWSK
jgi:predicted nucleic acid-binding protein